jgi:acetolactate synthase-1/3 small subunit
MHETPDAAAMVLVVHDRPGALAKIANVFHRRGLNIRSMSVMPAAVADHSRMVIGVDGACRDWQRIGLALDNLVDVVSVEVRPGPGVFS